jgi:hypothetical protein
MLPTHDGRTRLGAAGDRCGTMLTAGCDQRAVRNRLTAKRHELEKLAMAESSVTGGLHSHHD